MFDYYELRARIIPAAAVASSIVLPFLALGVNTPGGWMWTSLAATILLVIVYLFSFSVRYLGKWTEKDLWETWGGAPSSVALLHADAMFPESTKSDIKYALKGMYQIDLDKYVDGTDKWKEQTFEAFRLVRQYLRQHDSKGIWSVHNAEYGLLRNLLGASLLWLVIAGLATLLCLYANYIHQEAFRIALSVLAFAYVAVVLYARNWILPSLVRERAFRYAESAWLCFL